MILYKFIEDLVYRYSDNLLKEQIRDWRYEIGENSGKANTGNVAMIEAAKMVLQIMVERHPNYFNPRSYDALAEDPPPDKQKAVAVMGFYVQMMLRLISTVGNQAALASEIQDQFAESKDEREGEQLWERFVQTTKLESHIKSLRMNLSQSEWAKGFAGGELPKFSDRLEAEPDD